MTLVEGLEDGRWALALKMHHCLVDGVGSVAVVDALLDPEQSPGELRSPSRSSKGGAARRRPLPAPPQPMVQGARAGVRAAETTGSPA